MLAKELYGLQVMREWEPEADLILYRNEAPLTKEDIAHVEKKMLETYEVPGLLPLEFEEKDAQIRLRYRLPPGKTLKQLLSGKKLANQQIYLLLYAIVQKLEDCRIYMLDERRVVLQPNYIFVGADTDEFSHPQFVYIPICELPGKASVQQDLILLVDSLIKSSSLVPDEHWKAVKALLTNELGFSLGKIKQKLKEALHSIKHSPANNPGHLQTRVESMGMGESFAHTEHPPVSEDTDNVETNTTQNQQVNGGAGNMQEEADNVQANSMQLSNMKAVQISLVAAGVVLLASWSYYLNDRQDAWMYICLGVTLLVLDLVYILHVKGLLKRELFQTAGSLQPRLTSSPSPDNQPAVSVEEWAASRVAMLEENNSPGHNSPFKPSLVDDASQQDNNSDVEQGFGRASFTSSHSKPETEDYYSSLTQQTTLLVPQDATVQLADPFAEEDTPAGPFLELERDEGPEQLMLSASPFRIGRNQEGVHYTDLTVGVSRIHLEFTRNEEGDIFYVKDLGSKNGSYLNGERMVPYEEYPLNDEDEVRYAEVKAIFRR